MSATTPERWARIKALFQSALPLDAAERADHLDTGCEGDQELRGEVHALLASHDQNPEFLETSAFAVARPGYRGAGRRPRRGRRSGEDLTPPGPVPDPGLAPPEITSA